MTAKSTDAAAWPDPRARENMDEIRKEIIDIYSELDTKPIGGRSRSQRRARAEQAELSENVSTKAPQPKAEAPAAVKQAKPAPAKAFSRAS